MRVHEGGTYICMEGPLFSTKAESNVYRKLGMDIIGMTALPEAKLAREAELDYAITAVVRNIDCTYEPCRSGGLAPPSGQFWLVRSLLILSLFRLK